MAASYGRSEAMCHLWKNRVYTITLQPYIIRMHPPKAIGDSYEACGRYISSDCDDRATGACCGLPAKAHNPRFGFSTGAHEEH